MNSQNLNLVLQSRPVILHIGNVANNAHNAVYIDRQRGLNSFAISINYRHVMGMPFWETEELEISKDDHYSGYDLQSKYGKPSWFLYGSWKEVLLQLNNELGVKSNTKDESYFKSKLQSLIEHSYVSVAVLIKKYAPDLLLEFILKNFGGKLRKINYKYIRQIAEFADVIIFYGSQNFIATELGLGKKFGSFEHGTLRDYIWIDEEVPKNSLKAYKNSNVIQVTNQDNLEIAIELKMPTGSIICTPHPTIDSDLIDLRNQRLSMLWKSRSDLIIMPARHISESSSESGKGLTEIIKGVASILKEFPEISLQLYEWGDSVDLTKDLILKLGIENQVVWSKLVTRKVLKNRMANALAVIDQFKIPAFGAISTDAIAIGVPLLTSSNRDLNESFFGSDAPIFKTNIISDVQSNLGIILSERFNHIDYMSNSNIWYDTYLSSEVAFQKRLQTYKILLSE